MEGESVARALEVVGERWTLLILREAFFGVRRFGQLAHNLQIPRPTLSARLRTLVENGLLDKVPYARDPDRHEYQLTASGRDLFAAIVVLMRGAMNISHSPWVHQSCCAISHAVT